MAVRLDDEPTSDWGYYLTFVAGMAFVMILDMAWGLA